MALEFEAFTMAVNGLTIGGFNLVNIVPVIAIFLCSLAITRNMNYLQVIQLPMAVAFIGAGYGPGYLPLLIYIVLFSLQTLNLSNLMETTGSIVKGVIKPERKKAPTMKSIRQSVINKGYNLKLQESNYQYPKPLNKEEIQGIIRLK